MRIHAEFFFSFINFGNLFLYFVEKEGSCGSTSNGPRDLKLCMLVYISKKNGMSFAANSSQILDPPNALLILLSTRCSNLGWNFKDFER